MEPAANANLKYCRAGNHMVPRDQFGRDSHAKDGHYSVCKAHVKLKNAKFYQMRKLKKAVSDACSCGEH